MTSTIRSGSQSRSIATMSRRGVMIARMDRSPKRMTPAISSFSSGSRMPVLVPSAMIARISSSVTDWSRSFFSRSTVRRSRLERSSTKTTGAATLATSVMAGATRAATASGLPRAICFGTSSPTISDR